MSLTTSCSLSRASSCPSNPSSSRDCSGVWKFSDLDSGLSSIAAASLGLELSSRGRLAVFAEMGAGETGFSSWACDKVLAATSDPLPCLVRL